MTDLNFKNWRFHEADVNTLVDDGNSIVIELGDVCPEDADADFGKRLNIRIKIERASQRMIENQSCKVFSYLFDDGEVVFIEIKDNFLSALIKWTDYKTKPTKDCTLSYRVCGENISITELS